MTKGRAVLPGKPVAGRSRFSLPWSDNLWPKICGPTGMTLKEISPSAKRNEPVANSRTTFSIRSAGIRTRLGGVDAHAHSIQLASAFLRFGGLRITLHQRPQFANPSILLSHFNQRLSLAQLGRWEPWVTRVLLQNRVVALDRLPGTCLAVVDLTQVKLGISRQRSCG
jgi:hypothetical protein